MPDLHLAENILEKIAVIADNRDIMQYNEKKDERICQKIMNQ
jgi:hypothetical protein